MKNISSFTHYLTAHNHFYLKVVINGILRVLGAVITFALYVKIARSLGASEAGVYFFAFAIIMFLSNLVRLGADQSIVRFTSKALAFDHENGVWNVICKAGGLVVLLATSGSILFYLIVLTLQSFQAIEEPISDTLQNMSLSILGLALVAVISSSLLGMQRVAASIIVVNILTNLMMLVGIYIWQVSTAEQLGFYLSISSMLAFFIGFIIWFKWPSPKVQQPFSFSWAQLFASCLPLWVVAIMAQTSMWSSQIIAGVFVESAELANLTVALRTALLISFPVTSIISVVTPRFAALYAQNKLLDIQKLVTVSVQFSALITIPLAIGCFIFAPQIMSFFGNDFETGITLFRIVMISNFIHAFTGTAAILLTMSGHEKDFKNIIFFTTIIQLILELIFIPIFGVLAAAIVVVSVDLVFKTLLVLRVRKVLNIKILAFSDKTLKN